MNLHPQILNVFLNVGAQMIKATSDIYSSVQLLNRIYRSSLKIKHNVGWTICNIIIYVIYMNEQLLKKS